MVFAKNRYRKWARRSERRDRWEWLGGWEDCSFSSKDTSKICGYIRGYVFLERLTNWESKWTFSRGYLHFKEIHSLLLLLFSKKHVQFVGFVFHRKMWNSRRIKDACVKFSRWQALSLNLNKMDWTIAKTNWSRNNW